jgi:VWFA-related protein
MRKGTFIIGILFLILFLPGQELQEEAIAINVEVPVRVFKGNTFIDNLTMEDFEIYEDGKLQKIEAIYLIKKTDIKREEAEKDEEEARKKFAPKVSRNFVLLFELTDYLPKIKDALGYFCKNVIMQGDTLKIVTPLKAYNIKEESMEKLPKEKFAELLNEKVRTDTIKGNAKYKSLIQEVLDPINPPELLMDYYRRLRDYILFDERKLLEFAEYMKSLEGQKHIFLFFQKRNIPIPKDMDFFAKSELMTDVTFDENKIRKALSDSSISVHFLYITKEEGSETGITEMQSRSQSYETLDQSMQIFSAFKKMAQVTGGVTESSANISFSMEEAAQASENYYLLYYAPKDYRADGKFKNIKVKVKGRNYRVTHRAGYIAD